MDKKDAVRRGTISIMVSGFVDEVIYRRYGEEKLQYPIPFLFFTEVKKPGIIFLLLTTSPTGSTSRRGS